MKYWNIYFTKIKNMNSKQINIKLLNWASWSLMTSSNPSDCCSLHTSLRTGQVSIGALHSRYLAIPFFVLSSLLSFFNMRPQKSQSLRKCQLCSTVLSTVVHMFYIRSSDLIHLRAESLYPSTNLSLFPPAPGNHFSTLCLYVFFVLLLDSIYKWYHIVCLFSI